MLFRSIAAAGEGVYVRADNSNAAQKAIIDAVNNMNKTELESRVYSDYDEKYQVFLLVSFLILLINIFILDRKNSVLSRIKFFEK